jgi:tetratricopeptide (TPR) repeat protein
MGEQMSLRRGVPAHRAYLFFVILSLLFATLPWAPVATASDPVSLNNYALDLLNRGEYDKALEEFQRAYSLNAYDPTVKRNLAEAYAYVGRFQLEKNKYDDAALYFDNAGQLFPDDSRYAVLRGIALYFAKRYDAAAYELERARGLGGDTVEVLYFLGRVRYDTDNLAGALELWDKALELDPANKPVKELADKARRELAVEGRMGKGYSARFNISYDSGKSDLADSVLETLENAYNRVGSDLDYFPTARVPVILYTQRDYRTVTAGPDWSGGLYDGKIRLPIGGAKELADVMKGVLFHEYTHVVVRELTGGNCPTWLNEGLAELEGRKQYNPPLHEIARAVRNGSLLSLASLEGSYTSFDGKQALLAYEQSYSIVTFMTSTYGWYKVREILVNLGSGMPVAAAVTKELADFGLDYARVEQEWRDYIRRELGDR